MPLISMTLDLENLKANNLAPLGSTFIRKVYWLPACAVWYTMIDCIELPKGLPGEGCVKD